MMKKVSSAVGRNGKERRTGNWSVSLIVGIQIVGIVLFSMAAPGSVEAVTFTVNSTLDETDTVHGDGVCRSASGDCTLRAAIQEANWLDGPDSIKLNAGLYMLTIPGKEDFCASGDLDILSDGFGNDDLTITGMGANKTFINGGKLDRVFHILSPVSVTIAKVTIQNGLATEGGLSEALGGGILTTLESTLTLKECTISNNTASHTVDAKGGGIYSEGTLTITKSTFWNNSALSGRYSWGGGIYSRQAALTIRGSSLSNNSASGNDSGLGGGICSFQSGSTTITQCSLSSNSASGGQVGERAGHGGAIYNFDGALTITGSSLFNNSASGGGVGRGGGICNDINMTIRTLTIANSSLSNNSASGGNGLGGGICSGWAEVRIRRSTLSQNAASGRSITGAGGGIYLSDGTLTVLDESKIIRNFSSDDGGGIYYSGSGSGTISADSTVAKNIPYDIYPLP